VASSGRFRPHLQLRGSDGFSPSFLCGALFHRLYYGLSEGIPNVNGFFSIKVRAYGNMPLQDKQFLATMFSFMIPARPVTLSIAKNLFYSNPDAPWGTTKHEHVTLRGKLFAGLISLLIVSEGNMRFPFRPDKFI
jgi:hypothetical protein